MKTLWNHVVVSQGNPPLLSGQCTCSIHRSGGACAACSLHVRMPGRVDALGRGLNVPDLHLGITLSGRSLSSRPLSPSIPEPESPELEVTHA